MAKADSQTIGIVGGGLGGLAAACTLASRGYSAILFEHEPDLGGRAGVFEAKGFRFDRGPTSLALPSVLRVLFAEAGERLEDVLRLHRLDPQWRCYFPDGTTLDFHAEPEALLESIGELSPGTDAAEGFRRFLGLSEKMHEITNRYFFWRSVGSLADTVDLTGKFTFSALADLVKLQPGRTFQGLIRQFVHEPRIAQMLTQYTRFVGSSPENSPAVLCSIAHMQTGEGIWYPEGGMAELPRALAQLARRLGVEVRTSCEVRRILEDNGCVAGVETAAGERISLGAVISNADVVRTHKELLGRATAQHLERRRKYEPSCSGVVLWLGLKKAYPHLLHHNFVFSADSDLEFDDIYRRGEPTRDPTCYVSAPARTDPAAAPSGGEALYVLVHVPYLRPHHDWRKMFPEYRRVILDKLARGAGLVDLEERIVFEEAMTPQDLHERYHVRNGAIYGLSTHGRFFGAFKSPNRSSDVEGLYLAGGTVHPGPGVPMVLMSGWIAADSLDHDRVVEPVRPAVARAPHSGPIPRPSSGAPADSTRPAD